jgi:hypothetical protein
MNPAKKRMRPCVLLECFARRRPYSSSWVGGLMVASLGLGGGQVAVLRPHVMISLHVTIAPYSCERGRCITQMHPFFLAQNDYFADWWGGARGGEHLITPSMRTSENAFKAKSVVTTAYKPMVTSWVRSWRGLRNSQSNLTARLKSRASKAGICQTRPHSLTVTRRSGFRWHDTRRRQAKLASTTTHVLMPAILHELAAPNFRERTF